MNSENIGVVKSSSPSFRVHNHAVCIRGLHKLHYRTRVACAYNLRSAHNKCPGVCTLWRTKCCLHARNAYDLFQYCVIRTARALIMFIDRWLFCEQSYIYVRVSSGRESCSIVRRRRRRRRKQRQRKIEAAKGAGGKQAFS